MCIRLKCDEEAYQKVQVITKSWKLTFIKTFAEIFAGVYTNCIHFVIDLAAVGAVVISNQWFVVGTGIVNGESN